MGKQKSEIGSTARRSGTKRAGTRGRFELEKVVSCSRGDQRWRTKLNFGSGKSLDDFHWTTTLWAAPKIGAVLGGGSVSFGLWLLYPAEQVKAKRQESGTLTVGQETEVPDAHEALRE